MTDETHNPDKELALLSLRLITDVSDIHISSPGMHQVRLLADDLLGMIETDTLMVAMPIAQEAVPVSDPEPWPLVSGNTPFWYPADPGPEATRSIADLMNQLAHRPIPLTEAVQHYRNVMVHVGEAVEKGAHSRAAIVTEQPAEGRVSITPIIPHSDAKIAMQPMPSVAPEQAKWPSLFMPGHPPLDLIGRLRSLIHDKTGMDIGIDYAKKVLTDIAGDSGKDTMLLNALERATKGDGVDCVEVRLDRTLVRFNDPGKLPDVWVGVPREALKRLAGIQKPD